MSWLVALRLEREDERLLDVSLTPSTRLSSSLFSNRTRLVSSDEDEDADDQRDRQHEPDSTKKKSKEASFEVEEDQHSGGRIDASTRHSFVHLSFRSTLETRAELLLFCFPTGQDRHRRSGRLALIESRLLGSFSFHTSSWPLAADDADRSSSLRSTSQGQTPSDRFRQQQRLQQEFGRIGSRVPSKAQDQGSSPSLSFRYLGPGPGLTSLLTFSCRSLTTP